MERVNLQKKWVVKGDQLYSKSKWSPYEGWELPGYVTRVVMNGKTKYLDGRRRSTEGLHRVPLVTHGAS